MKKKVLSLLLAVLLTAALAPSVLAAENTRPEGDTLSFYLVEYALKSGETMTSVCTDHGVSFSNYQTIIKNVNGIVNFGYLTAGKNYWIPATSAGDAKTYYAVYAHKVVSGDTIYNLCNAYGISMNQNQELILNLNNAKSLTSFNVGQTVLIPVYTALISTGSAAAPTVVTTGTTAVEATTTGTATESKPASQNKDYVAYYLAPYVLQSGENMTTVCSNRGVKFSQYEKVIANVNGIKNFNWLIAGKTYWVPASSAGSASEYYTVYAHVLAPGDTVYNLCMSYGISMSKYTDIIQKLNNVKGLTSFKANTVIYLPVYTTSSSASSGTTDAQSTEISGTAVAGGNANTSTTTVDNGNGTSTTTTVTTNATEKSGLLDPAGASKYYIVSYTIQSGDSLISICNDKGVSYSKCKELLTNLNGASALNSLKVGSSIWVPSTTMGNKPYMIVTPHTMAKGETVFSVSKKAGIDFNASYKYLTLVNAGVNFNTVKVGQKVAIVSYVAK